MLNRSNTSAATPREVHWESWLWQRCLAPKTSLVIFVLLILSLLIGQLVPQLPDDVLDDPAAYGQWVQTIPEPFARAHTILSRLGLFEVQRSLWFSVLLVLAATIGVVALINHFDTLWRPQHVLLHQLSPADREETVVVPTTVVEAIVEAVEALLGPTRRVVTAGRTVVHGLRPRWVQLFTALTWLGLLVSVAGVVVDMQWGWTLASVALSPQTVVHVDSDQTLGLVSFDRLRPQAILRIERGTRQKQITVTDEQRILTVSLRGQVVGPAGVFLQMYALNRDGKPLELYTYVGNAEPAQSLSRTFPPDVGAGDRDEVIVFIPSRDLVVQLWRIDQVNWQVVFSNNAGQMLAEQTRTSGVIEVNDTRLHLEATFYPTLALSYRPGHAVFLTGALLVIVGGIFSAWPVHWLWIEIAGERERIVVCIRHASSDKAVQQVVEQVQAALQVAGVLPPDHPTEGV